MRWRNPIEEKPKINQLVWIIDWHWKREVPGSYSINGGRYFESVDSMGMQFAYVEQCDEAGRGSPSWRYPANYLDMVDCDYIGAWLPAEELEMPAWLLPKEEN